MNTTRKLGFAATALAVLLTTAALAQEAGGQMSGQMVQNQDAMPGSMMGGGMSGMQGMMPMMQQMGPMMEACTEMMQAMTDQMQAPKAEPQEG